MIELNRRPFTVIGVVPASFRGVDPPGGAPFVRGVWLSLWTLPLLGPGNRHLVGRTTGWGMQAVGRLRPGVSLDQTKAQIGAAGVTLDREFPGTRHARTPWISPITDIDTRLFAGPVGLALVGIGTVTPLVLLIASANVEIAAARSRSLAAAAVGGLALLLSLIGIGAVAAQTVINRTHEIGVRMALGARSPDAVALVVRSTLVPVGVGLVVGTFGAALVTRVLSSQLYGLSSLDPAAFAGAVVMLILASCIASWIPARRAACVDPIIALRAE